MMNAEVTAENRPDGTKRRGKHQVPGDSSHPLRGARTNTHKNEGGIQVFIV